MLSVVRLLWGGAVFWISADPTPLPTSFAYRVLLIAFDSSAPTRTAEHF